MAKIKTEVGRQEINGLDQNGEWRVQTSRHLGDFRWEPRVA
jgi:hypothetical protein